MSLPFYIPAPKTAQEALQQARVNERAATLWQGGYSWERMTGCQAGPWYLVTGPDGQTYNVDPLLNYKCSCPFRQEHEFCKHGIAIAQVDAQMNEPDLPDAWDAIACAADRMEREVREAGFEEFDR